MTKKTNVAQILYHLASKRMHTQSGISGTPLTVLEDVVIAVPLSHQQHNIAQHLASHGLSPLSLPRTCRCSGTFLLPANSHFLLYLIYYCLSYFHLCTIFYKMSRRHGTQHLSKSNVAQVFSLKRCYILIYTMLE